MLYLYKELRELTRKDRKAFPPGIVYQYTYTDSLETVCVVHIKLRTLTFVATMLRIKLTIVV